MKCAVVTTLNHNPGDDFVRYGIYYLLRSLLGKSEIKEIHKHDATTKRAETQKIIDWADIVIIAGTPCYWYVAEYEHSGTSEWSTPIWRQKLLNSNKKVLNLGAGSYYPYHSDGSASLSSKPWCDFIRAITHKCSTTVVRDIVAYNLVKGFSDKISMASCPAAWVMEYFKLSSGKDILTGSFQNIAGHYPMGQEINVDAFRRYFRQLMYELARQHKIVIVSHSKSDFDTATGLLPNLKHHLITDRRKALEIYSRSKLYVGTRVHGAYSVISAGSPAILFSSDTRSRMMDIYNMPRYFVNDLPPFENIISQINTLMGSNTVDRIRAIKEQHQRIYAIEVAA